MGTCIWGHLHLSGAARSCVGRCCGDAAASAPLIAAAARLPWLTDRRVRRRAQRISRIIHSNPRANLHARRSGGGCKLRPTTRHHASRRWLQGGGWAQPSHLSGLILVFRCRLLESTALTSRNLSSVGESWKRARDQTAARVHGRRASPYLGRAPWGTLFCAWGPNSGFPKAGSPISALFDLYCRARVTAASGFVILL